MLHTTIPAATTPRNNKKHSTGKIGGTTLKQVLKDFPCEVCGGVSTGAHFGAFTCESCKSFYRRSESASRVYECIGNGNNNCGVSYNSSKKCSKCRFSKMKSIGMTRELVKSGRASKSFLAAVDAFVQRNSKFNNKYNKNTFSEPPPLLLNKTSATTATPFVALQSQRQLLPPPQQQQPALFTPAVSLFGGNEMFDFLGGSFHQQQQQLYENMFALPPPPLPYYDPFNNNNNNNNINAWWWPTADAQQCQGVQATAYDVLAQQQQQVDSTTTI